MAVSHQETHTEYRLRAQRRRWLLIGGLVMALLWAPRAVLLIARGWCASSQVLATEQEIGATRERVSNLESQVDYTDTAEGRDLEAKRQFGVGPRDEIWITVQTKAGRPEAPPPQAIGDRVHAWLDSAGDRCVGHVRYVGGVVRYWFGMDGVSDCPPAVTEVRDEPAVESEPNTEAPSG